MANRQRRRLSPSLNQLHGNTAPDRIRNIKIIQKVPFRPHFSSPESGRITSHGARLWFAGSHPLKNFMLTISYGVTESVNVITKDLKLSVDSIHKNFACCIRSVCHGSGGSATRWQSIHKLLI